MSFSGESDTTVPNAAPDVKHASSYKEGEPVGFGWGRSVYSSQWISKQYEEHTAYGGAQKPEWQYASIAARYCKGPIDFVGKVWSDGREIANWDYTFGPGEESKEFILNPSLASGRAFKAIVHRGTEDAPESGVANLREQTGQYHPPYRGYCWIEWINMDLGQGSNSIPSYSVEIGTHAPAIGDFAGGDNHPHGVNPFAAIYAMLLAEQAGNLDPALIDPAHVGAQCIALETEGVSGRTGPLTYCHPTFSARTTLGDAINTILSYIDGFIYVQDGKIRFGWFPNSPVDGSTLPEIAEADLTAKPSGAGFGDWNKGPTSAVVLFSDFERGYETAPARYNVPTNGESRLASALVRRDLPFIHHAGQAQLMAAEASVPNTSGDSGVNLTVLKSRAVELDGSLLMPGSRINWDYGPHSLDLVCRVTARRMQMGKASDTLTIVRERGAFPRPYAAAVDVRVLPTVEAPGEIDAGDVRLWFLPPGFGGARQIVPLINRTKRAIYRANLHFSPNGSAPWETILDSRFFVAKCAVAGAGIDAAAGVVRVTSTSVDFQRLSAQSDVAQQDDTLLMLLGNEVVSVGAVTVVSPGTYDLAILRHRQGTTASGHAPAEVSWLFYRAELRSIGHESFYQVRAAGVYNAGVATKYFKIQLFTIDEDGLAKPDDPGISLVLPDLSATDTPGTRTFRQPTAPTGYLRVGDMWYDTDDLNRAYRWDGSTWQATDDGRIDVLDDDISALEAAVAARIVEVTSDLAKFVASSWDNAGALLNEVSQRTAAINSEASARAAAILTEAVARGAAITTEQTVRQSGDDSLASSITLLTASVGTNAAAISTEATTRATADTALSTTIVTLASTVSGNTAAITAEATTRSTADSALSTSITSLTSVVSGNTAAILAESTTRASETEAMARDLSALTATLNDSSSTIARELVVRATESEAMARDLSIIVSTINDSSASVLQEQATRVTNDSALATSITALTATVGGVSASVTVLASAYVVGGAAVATWGFKLDGGGKVVKMQAIAASGGVQPEVGVIVFGGADLQSDNFSAGVSGWRWKANGDTESNNSLVRGTFRAGSGAAAINIDGTGGSFGHGTGNTVEIFDAGTGQIISLRGFGAEVVRVRAYAGPYTGDVVGSVELMNNFNDDVTDLRAGIVYFSAASGSDAANFISSSINGEGTRFSIARDGELRWAAWDALGSPDTYLSRFSDGGVFASPTFVTPTSLGYNAGWGPRMWDGSHYLELRFSGGVVQCRVDETTTFNLS